jgi:hypothetical protein
MTGTSAFDPKRTCRLFGDNADAWCVALDSQESGADGEIPLSWRTDVVGR